MPSSLTPHEFIAKWRASSLTERASAQQHFLDICRLIGHPAPADMDPKGSFFTFEAGAKKPDQSEGWADVWYKGHFAWEYKGKHGDLNKAYGQLLRYKDSLENPPLLIVADIDKIEIHTNFTNTAQKIYRLSLDDLADPKRIEILRIAFFDPEDLKGEQSTEQVTQKAAEHFAELADNLRKWGEDSHNIAHFLIRLLFCLFAEDSNLLPKNLISELVVRSRTRPKVFMQQLQQLFSVMATGGFFGRDEIPCFDGRLFEDDRVLELDTYSLDILADICNLDWSAIEPSIFGTLFERSLDPDKRSQLGAHYTSKEDILLIVEPVLMAPVRRKWQEVKAKAVELAAERDDNQKKKTARKGKLDPGEKLQGLLLEFTNELNQTTVLDPACGSGNFLYVALRQMMDLEKEVIQLAGELGLPQPFPTVNPKQLYGIEINPYAWELAQVTVWIGYIQWLRENGYGVPEEPVLKPLDNIKLMDAILAYDIQGNAIEPEWPNTNFIIGNPPFLGGKKLRNQLDNHYVDLLFKIYRNRVPQESDLVCYWFEKSLHQLLINPMIRIGLLATNSIRGGANRKILERIIKEASIFWAISDKECILEGANVHVSMIGFSLNKEKDYSLDGKDVLRINSDLSSEMDLTGASQLKENENISFMGVTPAGSFVITDQLAKAFLERPVNINNRLNSDVVRPYYNGIDITKRPRSTWIIDFGIDTSIEEASKYEAPFEYINKVVKPERIINNRKSYREKWWLFAETRPAMRRALNGLSRYIGTSMVSKHLIFSWIPSDIIPANLLIIFSRQDDYFFGILQSKTHAIWAGKKSTSLEDRPRYTPTSTFETFPFPWPPGKEPQGDARVEAIAAAAKELVEKRDAWLNPPGASEEELKKRTLTNLYNARPTWLELAHKRLDEAVFAAYGWPADLSDEEILERLLALNLERAKA